MLSAATPFLEDQLWVNIATRLDDVPALGRLACVARRFKLVVEQAATSYAASAVCAGLAPPLPTKTEGGASSYASKLQLLHEANTAAALWFSARCGPGVQLDCHSSVATSSGVFQPAVCGVEMRRHSRCRFCTGLNCWRRRTSAGNASAPNGVVAADFDAAAGLPAMNSRGCSNMLYTLSSPRRLGQQRKVR